MPRRFLAAVVGSGLVVASGLGATGAGPSGRPRPVPDATAAPSAAPIPGQSADAAAKLLGGLSRLAGHKDASAHLTVLVRATQRLDLSAYGARVHRFRWPAGEEMALVAVRPRDLSALSRNPAVVSVSMADPLVDRTRPADEETRRADVALMRRDARRAGPWTALGAKADPSAIRAAHPAAGGSRRPQGVDLLDGWFDIRDGHRAQEAWALGFRGEGVRVAVLDDAVDFAHPDLVGTWAVLPEGHPYSGWPQVFDPEVGLLAAADRLATAGTVPAPARRRALGGMIELYQEAAVRTERVDGLTRVTACLRPLAYVTSDRPRELGDETCDYVLPNSSKGGRVRFGHHPDSVLMQLGAREGQEGEWAGVLIVDEGVAGRLDTVYVDLDNDRDFSDEKPVRKDSPLAWRDSSTPPDGIQDISGGLLYWISDGALPFPGSWIWGLEDEVAAAGTVIGLHWVQGAHGTLCASNIVSQGRLGAQKDQRLAFRDLPGDGRPPALNFGLAPGASLVSVGDVYLGGDALFQAGWRYAVFGHSRDRGDDDIQVVSNSYVWSDVDNDRWDRDSRLIDHYVRAFSPSTVFLSATGNGGPGYGTLAPPSPATGVDVAASTQMGSTGMDSITDTTQIAFGDIIPFSNRGPGATGEVGPDLAADGADAAGAFPINYSADGRHSVITWGGTSRSTPVASGAMALVYQAFHQKAGRWPNWEEARAILMAGSRFAGHDVFTAGAGVVDAADAVRVAAGLGGIFAQPSSWSAGGYQGKNRPAFANVLAPGETASTRISLHNPSSRAVTVRLSGQWLRRLGSRETDLSADLDKEAGTAGEVPDYLLPIDKASIPADTDLMVLRGVYPLTEFDPLDDPGRINAWGLRVYQHTDIDHDGRLWEDRNGSGTVDSRLLGDSFLRLEAADGGQLIDAVAGGALPMEGIDAAVTWFGPACPDLNGVPAQPVQDPAGAIALLPDGDCDDPQMIARVASFGAVAAIVYDSEGGVRRSIVADNLLPVIMIAQRPAEALRDRLLAGAAVHGLLRGRQVTRGIDQRPLIDFAASEIEPFEFMRMSEEFSPRNSWELSIHHPLQRWADGLYLGLAHTGVSEAVTTTHFSFRYDFYGYRPWAALTLGADSLTIPAASAAELEVSLKVPADTAIGLLQGAIFADYDRGVGDEPVVGPGGWELPGRRLVIPVTAAVVGGYDWQGSRQLGGRAADDPEASYPNGTMRGAMNWAWRPESGDWRFFFIDTADTGEGSRLVTRLTWPDRGERRSDIDTRIFGRGVDRFPDVAAPVGSGHDQAADDPDWYGPYSLEQSGASPYLVDGSIWPFQTSSGAGEDWVAAPSQGGLTLLALQNVLYDGAAIEQPFELTLSSIRLNPSRLELYGTACADLQITPQLDLGAPRMAGYGLAPRPLTEKGLVIQQDDPQRPDSASFTRTLEVSLPTAQLGLSIDGREGDDLDLFLRQDVDGDGAFSERETVASSTSATAHETVSLRQPIAPGRYLVMVHGYRVAGGSGAFSLTTDQLAGDNLKISTAAGDIAAGQTAEFQVCPLTPADGDGPLRGLVTLGPAGAPGLLQIPVRWRRQAPRILLPLQLTGARLEGR